MATRPKKQTKRPGQRSTVAAAPAVENREEEFEDETADDIESFFAGASGESTVSVYRIGKPGEKDQYLDLMSISAFTTPGPEQVLSTTYGAGNYKCKLKRPNDRGQLVYGGQKVFAIGERPGVPHVNGNGHNAGQSYESRSEQRSHEMMLAVIASIKPQPAPAFDIAGLAALITAVNGGGNKQSDMGQLVSAFTSLKQSAEPPNTIAQIREAVELAKALTPGAPGAPGAGEETDTSWPGLIKGALSAFAGGAGAGAGPAGARRLPAGQPGGEEYEETGEEEMLQQFLTAQLGYLKVKAKAGKPVADWVRYTLENQEDAGNAAIMTALKMGATLETLYQFDAEIAQEPRLRVWFQQFYDGLKRPVSSAPVIPWFGRDITNTAGNEGLGADGQPAAGSPANGSTAGGPVEPGKVAS
jgi:hypothetical protein